MKQTPRTLLLKGLCALAVFGATVLFSGKEQYALVSSQRYCSLPGGVTLQERLLVSSSRAYRLCIRHSSSTHFSLFVYDDRNGDGVVDEIHARAFQFRAPRYLSLHLTRLKDFHEYAERFMSGDALLEERFCLQKRSRIQ